MNSGSNNTSERTSHKEIWSPPQELISSCALTRFTQILEKKFSIAFSSYETLHRWSIQEPEKFWSEAIQFLAIQGHGSTSPVWSDTVGPTPLARSWFPKLRLNAAENLLQGAEDQTAMISWSEDKVQRRISRGELRQQVSSLSTYLAQRGITSNDRVFAYIPNIPEAITCMLAAATLGVTWSSCGTDYQAEGLLSRIERVQPAVLCAALSYQWRGSQISLHQTINDIVSKTPSIRHVIFVDYLSNTSTPPALSRSDVTTSLLSTVTASLVAARPFEHFPFSHPLYIMFSSGTTGKPKGIVHGAGGTLLEHKKELILHSDLRPGDRLFYQTSTSWMMWNWLVSGLACQATLVLYDGDPMIQEGMILWNLANTEGVTHFGTSAAYIGELQRRGVAPGSTYDLAALRSIFSTGSPLYPEKFDFVSKAIKPLWLQSISGGTDIIGCFGLGCPLKPVKRGEVQCKSLGYDVQVFNSTGTPIVGEQGELVCASPAPSMPVYFLDDPRGDAYQSAYFADFPGVWRHGDFVEETPSGGLVFGGRSDATLKPGGVRVATADIYVALSHIPQIQDALAVGYTPRNQANEKIVLFVVLQPNVQLTQELRNLISSRLKQSNAFYVPALIIQAPELPRTTNNKLAELSVKRILSGQNPGNSSALANPNSLSFFTDIALPQVTSTLG